uniref:unspecific monooxygenase n=1 Tax=Plectus sambesii TaxID=2011161 RepID=A0A914X050_9BILA
MIAWTIVQLLVLVWAIRTLWKYFTASGGNKLGLPEPPGPYGLPVVGYMPFLGSEPHLAFAKLSQKYGDIFQVQLGTQKVVVLNSLDVIKEAYIKDASFAGRPNSASIQIFLKASLSSFSFRSGNAQCKLLRKIAIKALGMFSSSRNSRLEAVVGEATEELHAELEALSGQSFDPQQNIFDCVAGVIGTILFGLDFSNKDALLKPVLSINQKFANFFATGTVLDSLPLGPLIMRHKVKEFVEGIKPFNELIDKHVTEHMVHCEEEDDVRDVADAVALAAKQTPTDLKQQLQLTDDRIRCIASDLFGAGFATVMETFRWAINLLAAFPDVQERARRELAEVCGDRPLQLTDRSNIPYNEAVLLETFRFSSLLTLSLPHSTMEDTTLRGYFIPKGTTIFSNLFAHHYNPQYFPDPESFKPDRFLCADGKLDADKAQLVIPFGVGKRRCVGENLARQELSLLVGRLLQKFEIRQDPSNPVNVRDGKTGFTRAPIQTPLIFKKLTL